MAKAKTKPIKDSPSKNRKAMLFVAISLALLVMIAYGSAVRGNYIRKQQQLKTTAVDYSTISHEAEKKINEIRSNQQKTSLSHNNLLCAYAEQLMSKIGQTDLINEFKTTSGQFYQRHIDIENLGMSVATEISNVGYMVGLWQNNSKTKENIETNGDIHCVRCGQNIKNSQLFDCVHITANSVLPTSTPKPVSRNQKQAQQGDPDPPVHCQIDPMCGGGSKPLKRSECDNLTCCLTGDGFRLITKADCISRQGKTNQQNTPYNYKYPTYAPISPFQIPTYAPLPTYQAPPTQPPPAIPTTDPAIIQACLNDANNLYQQELDICRTTDFSSSFEQAICELSARNRYDSARNYCIIGS